MSKKQCEAEGPDWSCDKKHYCKGLCDAHRTQQRRGKELRPLRQPRRCEAGDGLGWSCDNKHEAKGLCNAHWRQHQRGQQLKPLRQVGRVRCEAGDGLGWSCIKPHKGNGLCGSHAGQRERGKPFAPIYVVTDATARSVMHAAGFSPSVPYPGNDKPWPGVCLKCGERGAPWYSSVQQGNGACKSCARSGIDYNKPAIFYTVVGGGWLKCGIANTHRTDGRLREHRKQGLTDVLHVLEFESGHDALALEDLWLQQLAKIPALARPTKTDLPDGYTEACRDVPTVRRWIDQHLVALAA